MTQQRMPTGIDAGINPEILVWARETSGLSRDEAARKLGFQNSSKSSADQKLEALETGNKEPTRPQLLKMARQYRRPLLTFYLSNPPVKGDRGADFRSLSSDSSPRDDALLDALVRDIQARQSMVRAVLEDDEEAEPMAFVGSRSISDGQASVLEALQELLDVELATYRKQRTAREAFDLLRGSAEGAGVFVILQGNLGSYHTAIETETFRGFSIADGLAPFVVINPHDARPALSFTLLHELVHLLLGQTGISASRAENDTEQFCDAVAGEFLLPVKELAALSLDAEDDFDAISERISKFANDRNLSRTMVAYNFYLSDRLSQETFRQLSAGYRQQWMEERARDRERVGEREIRINPDVTRRYQLGTSLLNLVRRMRSAGEFTTVKAAMVMGVRPGRVESLLSAAGQV